MTKFHRNSRRNFLKSMGLSTGSLALHGPMQLLLQSIVQGLSSQAQAQLSGANARKYIYFIDVGAPPRWVFDLFLTPYSSDGFISNPLVATRYKAVNGRYVSTEYATTKIGDLNVPWMWQFDVPRSGGGMRPMAELLNSMLQVRGLSCGNASHISAQALQFRPLGSPVTNNSFSADNSNTPIASIDFSTGPGYLYQSAKGSAPVRIGQGNGISQLLEAFSDSAPNDFKQKRDTLSVSIEAVTQMMDDLAVENHPAVQALSLSRQSAASLMKKSFGNLDQTWNSLLNKYKDLISRAIDPSFSMAGLTDLPIGSNSTRDKLYQYQPDKIATQSDLRNIFSRETMSDRLAETFALGEFIMRNNLSSSYVAPMFGFSSLNYGPEIRDMGFDEHETGTMVSLLQNTMYFRALATCMLEFFDQLKIFGVFAETIFENGGEFGRNPRTTGFGSDHAPQSGAFVAYSGIIKQPLILGNTLNASPQGDSLGSWGWGAGIDSLAGAQLDVGHKTSTLATLLRVPSPLTARPSLILEQAGLILPAIEKAKQT